VRAILGAQGETVAPDGSFNNHVGAPISMLRIENSTRYLVVEMGASHAGEIAHLVSIARPDIGVVLKVGLAHVGEFGGIDAIQRAKAEMVTELPSTATAILNADDPRVVGMASLTGAAVRWFGLSDSADLRAENVVATSAGTSFDVVAAGRRLPVRLRILGEHHVMNALAALSVARELGLDLGKAIAAIEVMPRAERWRMELLTAPSGAVIINDAYNASPDSMAAALTTLAQIRPARSRSIAVLGEMTELGDASDEQHSTVGRLAAELRVDELIVVGAGARAIHTAAGAHAAWSGRSVFVETPDAAHALLAHDLRAGDVVLVKSSKSGNLRFLGDRLAGVTES
jgi:UDP-N-acetylmuramoyl-tripeptide--D-alanyl-D-alanine ligase